MQYQAYCFLHKGGGKMLEELRTDMANNGYQFKDHFVIGSIRRFSVGKGNNKDGHFQVWDNGNNFYHAEYGDWKTGKKYKWNSNGGKPLSPTQTKQIKQVQQKRADNRAKDQEQAGIKANEIYAKAKQSTVFNAYLKAKGFDQYQGLEHPARQDDRGNLIIPLSSDGQIKSLQIIHPNGDKRLLKNGLKKGTFCILGDLLTLHKNVYVCEGYATALSVYLAFEQKRAVVFAIDCGNLFPVFSALKGKYKSKQFINCADNDHTKAENAGKKQAKAIKEKLGIPFIYPDFIKGTDFDDQRQEKGLEAVKERLLSIVIDNAKDGKKPDTLDKILQGTELFKNTSDEPYITINDGRTIRIDSIMFKNWLVMEYHKETGSYLKDSKIKDIAQNVRSRAIFGIGNKNMEVFNRVGYSDDQENIYIDLVDENFNLVQLSQNGWNVITPKSIGVKFETTQNMNPLPYPTGGGDINKLWQHTNITKDIDKSLVLAWLINCLIPFGGYPILVLYGGQGTAKSTTQSNLRDLIDPSIGNLRDKKANADFLGVQAVNNYIVSLNNLGTGREGLNASEQNTLCNISLGGAISDRKKYTDYEESMKAVKNPIMMNGISGFVTAQDLISRSIIITLDAIDSNQRKRDSQLKQAFDQDKAEIFGALLDLTTKVLKVLPTLKVNNLPRMAEFGMIGTALEQILDKTKGKFLDNYKYNQGEAIAEVLESEPVIIVLMAYLEKQAEHPTGGNGYLGSWVDLVKWLKEEAPECGVNLDKLQPRGLSAKIRANEPALKTIGVNVKYLQRTKKGAMVDISVV